MDCQNNCPRFSCNEENENIDKNDFDNWRDDNIKDKRGYRIDVFMNSNRQTKRFGVRRWNIYGNSKSNKY